MSYSTSNQTILSQYAQLENELASLFIGFKMNADLGLRLPRMAFLLSKLGDPHQKFRSIHVGGTSGKGSTSTMVGAILQEAGYRVGLHTSPHLQIVNERHRINGQMVATSKLYAAWKKVERAIELVLDDGRYGGISYFEAQVALSFVIFAEERVDFAVVEVGLGGRYDPTNVIPADIAILTSVGLDHTDVLGNTVEEIAQDKSGIIKPNQQVISGCWQPTVQKIIAQTCQQKGARLWQSGHDFRLMVRDAAHADFYFPNRVLENVEINLQGEFQAQNAAAAILATLSLKDVEIKNEDIYRAMQTVNLAGRVEIVQHAPMVILDGAHNPDKIRASASMINHLRKGKRVITVLGVKKGKDAAEIVPPVTQLSDEVILTTFTPKGLWKALEPEQLKQLVVDATPDLPVSIVEEPLEAMSAALDLASPNDIIFVTGSLYLVGDMRERWFPTEKMLASLEENQ